MSRRAALLLAVVTLAVAGCGGDESGARLRLVIPDNNIRTEGVECSGARPFRHVHRGTSYRIEAGDGTIVAEGELPAGSAENADPSIDWESDRIPTVCVMELDVDLPQRPRYRFVLDGSLPIEFEGALLDRDEPVLLVLTG
jgi:hypothetical protein